ncbi:hypothetical protein bcgnr5384_56390 [Bacillus cereus]
MERINFHDYDLKSLKITENIACVIDNYASYHITFVLPKYENNLYVTVINDADIWRLGTIFQVRPKVVNYHLDPELNEKLLCVLKDQMRA